MSRLTWDGTAEPVSRDQILRHARGQGNIIFPCSTDHEKDWQPYSVDPYSAICDDHTYIHTYRHRFLPALAKIVPAVVPYASNVYAREPPKFLFALDSGGLEAVELARGVQQKCNLGPLCYSVGSLKILK